jgi:ribosomally synthesized peptide (two-chain TOMM family)
MTDNMEGKKAPSSGDELLDFRALWLRAIAEAWTDSLFKAALLHDPAKALEERFKYVWPWSSLTLKVVDSNYCKWIGTDWIWPVTPTQGEGIKLYVPLTAPKSATPDQYGAALADYYRLCPSLLMSNSLSWTITCLDSKTVGRGSSPSTGSAGTSVPSPAPVGGFVPASIEFANFEVALLYALARAWVSVEFREYLQQNERFAMASCHGYEAPWVLPVTIADGAALVWDPEKSTWDGVWPNELTVGLPVAPVEVMARPVALAAYNATGAQFPFTCCP